MTNSTQPPVVDIIPNLAALHDEITNFVRDYYGPPYRLAEALSKLSKAVDTVKADIILIMDNNKVEPRPGAHHDSDV